MQQQYSMFQLILPHGKINEILEYLVCTSFFFFPITKARFAVRGKLMFRIQCFSTADVNVSAHAATGTPGSNT